MAPRLPVELQLYILELAIPPLTSTNFASRRELCKRLSLVHSAWTGTAQAALDSVFELNLKDEEFERALRNRILRRVEEKNVRVDGVVFREAFVWTPEGHPLRSNKPLLRLLQGIKHVGLDNSAEEDHIPSSDEAFPGELFLLSSAVSLAESSDLSSSCRPALPLGHQHQRQRSDNLPVDPHPPAPLRA